MENKVAMEHNIYASFFLGNSEFAINVSSVQEVVNYPPEVSTMPLAPDYLDGIFNLRGIIIPIINLGVLLRCPSTVDKALKKIAILEIQGVNLGVVFDSTGEIIRPSAEQVTLFQYDGQSEHNVVGGAIKIDSGQRLIQLLDAQAVIAIKNLPQLEGQFGQRGNAASMKARKQITNRKKCITFTVAGVRLAFEIMGIHEIVLVPEIQKAALNPDICLGLINLRGQTIPVISFAKILGVEQNAEMDAVKRRIVILKIANELFGLLVDSVENISFYVADEIMSIPLFNKERMDMFMGCIVVPDIGDVLLLNHERVLENSEIREVTHNHAKIYQVTNQNETSKKGGTKKAFISFKLSQRFGIPISDVREIIEFPENVLPTPGMPDYVLGVLNLRGRIITIIDSKTLYGMKGKAEEGATVQNRKILVVQKDSVHYGLVVDSIESIVHVDQDNKMKVPEVLSKLNGTVDQDVAEIVDIPGVGGIVILNFAAVLNRIEGGSALTV